MWRVFLVVASAVGGSSAQAVDGADVAALAQLFAGEFDSYEQSRMEERAQIPMGERHTQVYLIHKPVDLPAFGSHAFYVEEYRDGEPENIIRQRIVTFEADTAEGAIRMKQYFLRNEAEVRGAHVDPGKLAAVSKDQAYVLPGCDVFWTRDGESFAGAMKEGQCVFSAKPGDPERSVIYPVGLADFQDQRVDRSVYGESGKTAGGRSDDLPTVHKRVRGAP